jgi:hypothetical protein
MRLPRGQNRQRTFAHASMPQQAILPTLQQTILLEQNPL